MSSIMSIIEENPDKYHNMISDMIRDKQNGTIKKYSYSKINKEMNKDKLFTTKQKNELYNSIVTRVPEDINETEWKTVVVKAFLNMRSTKRSGGKRSFDKTQKKRR